METPQAMRVARAAQQAGQRGALLLRIEVPHRVLQRRLGHAVAADLMEERGHRAATHDLFADQPRRKFALGDQPRRVNALFREVRVLAGDALAPGGEPVGFDLDQQDAARGGAAKARLKGTGKRHVDLA